MGNESGGDRLAVGGAVGDVGIVGNCVSGSSTGVTGFGRAGVAGLAQAMLTSSIPINIIAIMRIIRIPGTFYLRPVARYS